MRIALVLAGMVTVAGSAWGEDLRHGRYGVSVEITLPNIAATGVAEEVEICWMGTDDPGMALGPLGRGPLGRGPLKNCPSTAISRDGEIHVTTTCPGPNAGFASAVYRLVPGGFRATVDLNMGGKNMRVGERQRGRYLGRC